MHWDAIAAPDIKHDLILFDGDCVLCSHWARFVHERDTALRFKFVAIQSEYGRELAARFGIDPLRPESNLAVVDGRVYFKSSMAIAIMSVLSRWRRVAALVRVVPRGLRNWLYDRIARNRYRWFGRREQCWAGDPAFSTRILERAP